MFVYEIRTAFMVLLLAQNIFGNSSSLQQNHTHVTEQPNSSIAPAKSATEANSHGSKLLQSVPLIANHPQHQLLSHESTTAENFTNIIRLENVLVVFDLNELATNWPKIRHELRSNCQHDMNEYFRGLQQHKIWAIKSKLQSFVVCVSFHSFFVEATICDYVSCLYVFVVYFIANFFVYKMEKIITTKLQKMNVKKSSVAKKSKGNERKPPPPPLVLSFWVKFHFEVERFGSKSSGNCSRLRFAINLNANVVCE